MLTVIVSASILTGMRKNIITLVQEFGTDNIFAFHLGMGPRLGRRPREEWLRKPLGPDDAAAILSQCPSVQDVTWEGFAWDMRVKIQYRENSLRQFNFNGVPANYATIANLRLAQGRYFSEPEDEHRLKVVVLGPNATESLFPDTDPIGKQVQINGHPFTVIGLSGHSDADVLTHAIGEAFLGAVAAGDLGAHFPDSDPSWHNISSLVLLERIVAILKERGYAPVNVDATVVAEKPRLAPHLPAMTARLAPILGLVPDAVSLKATTTEKMGFAGREEGIAAYAVVLVEKAR